MKNTKFLLFAGLLCLLAVACKKDEGGFEKTLDKFVVGDTDFKSEDDSKVALQFSTRRLLYEEGDYIKVNGKNYTLSKSGSGASTEWYANGPGVTAENFYCAYADGVSTTLSGYTEGGSSYHFDLAGRLSSPTNKILLGGVTESNVLTLRPACAIIRIVLNDSYSNVKVAFENTKVVKSGTMNITSSEVTISPETFLTGVTEGSGSTGGGADFLSMEHDATNGYWYVAVPVSSSVTTTLYFYWELGGAPTGYKTSGRVTLTKGYVYTVGATRQSPFNANGTSKNYFRVGASTYVQFSPGNLQAKKTVMGNNWQFASTQLDVLGSAGASAISGEDVGSTWDLFGFGTSNWNSGAATSYAANSYSNNPSDYISYSLTGSYVNADWGVNNGTNIRYQGSPSGTTWRTLTSSEWSFLMGRTEKVAFATVKGIKGVLLLPDVASNGEDPWEMPGGLTLNYTKTSYSNNTISESTWNTLEASGAIFLPATGYRQGTSYYGNTEGYYWSSTYDDSFGSIAYGLVFNGSSASVLSTDYNSVFLWTSNGFAVRLVHAL